MAIAAVTCNSKKATSASADGPIVLRLSVTNSSGSPGQRLVIKLPDWRVLRIVARSVLVALALVSLPWLGLGNNGANNNAATATVDAEVGNHQNQQQRQPIDDVYFLPMLLRDLKRSGVFQPSGGRAVYLGAHAHLRIPFLRRNAVEPVTLQTAASVPDRSVGLLLAADGVRDPATVASVDRLVGVVAVRLSDDPARASPMPHNYMLTYVRRFGGSTIVAMKKTADLHASAAAGAAATGRKLLMMPIALSKKQALDGLEDVLLEPPRGSSRSSANKFLKRTRYLPDLTGDTLDGYPRLLFVDVGPGPGRGDNRWFEKHYPTRNRQFEIIRVETEEDGSTMVDPPPPEDNDEEEEWMEPEDGVSTWLRANVREEDYVVMKAEAEVVEGLVRSRAIELVDELFFGCSNQWQKGAGRRLGASRRAYWECLALYGKLRDKGVAVHQWWG